MIIIGLKLDNGKVQPLAWRNTELSTKELRKATKQFKSDSDVVEPCQMEWSRLYNSKSEAKKELPRY